MCEDGGESCSAAIRHKETELDYYTLMQNARTSRGLRLPKVQRGLVMRALRDVGHATPDGGARADLLFCDVRAEPRWSAGRDVVEVSVTATVTNNSGSHAPLSEMPMPFCLETDTYSRCLASQYAIEAVPPGKTIAVHWQIHARDEFELWALVQTDEDPLAERRSFSGLGGLPKMITDSLREGFSRLREETLELKRELTSAGKDAGWCDRAIDRIRYIVDDGDCFHTSMYCSDMYAPGVTLIRFAYLNGYRPCGKCVGSDWWLGVGLENDLCVNPSGLTLPTTGSVWVSTSEGGLICSVGPDEWLKGDPIRAVSFSGEFEWVSRDWDIRSMPEDEVLSRFFCGVNGPEAVRDNGGCHYQPNASALRIWHAQGRAGRRGQDATPAPAGHDWWIADLANMRGRYRELREDDAALLALFPGHDIDDIRRQARSMGLEPAEQATDTRRAGAGDRPDERRQGTQRRPVSVARRPDTSGKAHDGDRKGQARRGCAGDDGLPQSRRQRPSSGMSKTRLHARPWSPEEDAILRRWFPRYGANQTDWPEKLYGRKRDAIEQRARKLDLRERR